MPRSNSKTSSQKLNHITNKAKVLDLRIKGLSVRKIAQEIGISPSHVYFLLKEGFSEIRKVNEDLKESLIDIELERLDNLQINLNDALEKATKTTDKIKLTETLLKTSESRRRLLGLDVVKTPISLLDLNPKVTQLEIDIRPSKEKEDDNK